jgi:hypothetical protein
MDQMVVVLMLGPWRMGSWRASDEMVDYFLEDVFELRLFLGFKL